MFSCVAKRLLGTDFAPSEDLTSAYLHAASATADAAGGEGKEAEERRAEAFLRGTEDFRRKYAVILEKVVLGTRGILTKEEACLPVEEEEAWAREEEAYLDRLRDEWSYDVEELKRDVHDALKTRLRSGNDEVLRRFHDVYGRPMFVQEFLRYRELSRGGDFPSPSPDASDEQQRRKKSGTWSSADDWEREFRLDRPYTTLLCNVIRRVYDTFMGVEVSEYEVVARYLPLLAKAGRCAEAIEDYFEAVTEEAIAHDGYVTAMSAKVASLYTERYGTRLVRGSDDAAYLVKKVRHLRMSLVDERLTDVVRDFQMESDHVNDAVACAFETVLNRSPEQDELNDYQDVFRRDEDGSRAFVVDDAGDDDKRRLDDLKAFVERDIVSGLEFHEVIKQRLKTACGAEQPVTRVTLYGRLKHVIERIHGLPFEDRTLELALRVISEIHRSK